jgi:hypothetical protein
MKDFTDNANNAKIKKSAMMYFEICSIDIEKIKSIMDPIISVHEVSLSAKNALGIIINKYNTKYLSPLLNIDLYQVLDSFY